MSQITVISGPERRRVWTDQQKRELVAAVTAPGANVAEIARRADLRPNQIYRWRRQMGQAAQGFAEVQVQPDPMLRVRRIEPRRADEQRPAESVVADDRLEVAAGGLDGLSRLAASSQPPRPPATPHPSAPERLRGPSSVVL